MSLATSLLAPLAMLLPAAGTVQPVTEVRAEPDMVAAALDGTLNGVPGDLIAVDAQPVSLSDMGDTVFWQMVVETFRDPVADQVRIERHVTIRIAPRPAPMPPPNMLMDMPSRPLPPRTVERAMGNCVPVAGIAGVQANTGTQLMLYMRDRRVVRASLERSCPASSFYQGFYLQRTEDGQLCVNRDTLLSRSGANCKLTRLRQLIPQD